MFFRVFGGSLGLVLGALGGLLGPLFALLGGLGGTPNFQNFLWGALEPPSAPILAPEEPPTTPNSSPGALFLILEPLGVDFELPRGPSHPQKP